MITATLFISIGLQHRDKQIHTPDSKIHGDNMGPTWVLSAPDGPHVGPMNPAIRDPNGDDGSCFTVCIPSVVIATMTAVWERTSMSPTVDTWHSNWQVHIGSSMLASSCIITLLLSLDTVRLCEGKYILNYLVNVCIQRTYSLSHFSNLNFS